MLCSSVRRILKEKRIGHTGTLDPLATGVLVLCVGKATRIAQYLEAGEKEYQAVMRLGVTTDTLDAEGRVLETRTYVPPDRAQSAEGAEELYRSDHAAAAGLFCGKGRRCPVLQAGPAGKGGTAQTAAGHDLTASN